MRGLQIALLFLISPFSASKPAYPNHPSLSYSHIPTMRLNPTTDAIIVVDVQNDFLPGGSLATPNGNQILEPIYTFMHQSNAHGILIAASRDYHPAHHISFKEMGGQWPIHCVKNTYGAEFAPNFPVSLVSLEVHKGTRLDKDAYSAFEDTILDAHLSRAGVKRVFIVGIATEYCVWSTARDAKVLGYEVVVVEDLVAEVVPESKREKLDMFRAAGLVVVHSSNLRF